MKKMTMLTYLDEQIEKTITNYDVALDWDNKNRSIEVIVRLFAENKERMEIDDAEGVASEEEVIEFEDSLLFFDPKKTTFDEEDYLAAIPYEGKKGVSKAVVDAVISYLNDVLDEGQSDLLDFLDETSDEAIFELKWDNEKVMERMTEYQQAGEDTFLPYPSY